MCCLRLETTSLLDEAEKVSVHAFYEIEGQINGRLRCAKQFSKGYIPHTIGPDQKKALKPKGYNRCFMSTDIRHCEVTVLQWLSQDPNLLYIIESGQDLYKEIYHVTTGDPCDSDKKRDYAKRMFLPVMYGCGPTSLGKSMGLAEQTAKELIRRIHAKFPVATEWMRSKQEEARENGVVVDYFGRPRTFENEFYKARNFVVQGVAATACVEKLIAIYDALQGTESYLCFTIHDAYGIVCPVKDPKPTYTMVKDIVESESTACPGLRLKQESKFGKRLDNMKVLWR